MTKLSNLTERIDRLGENQELPPLPPDPKCLVGKECIRLLLVCDELDKKHGIEAVNAKLEQVIAEGGGEKWCNNPAAVESLRLRHWFMEHDKLENLIPRLCYTTEISQVEADIEKQEADLESKKMIT